MEGVNPPAMPWRRDRFNQGRASPAVCDGGGGREEVSNLGRGRGPEGENGLQWSKVGSTCDPLLQMQRPRPREDHSVLEGLQLVVDPSKAPCWPCHGHAPWKCWGGWCRWSTLLPSGRRTARQLLVCFCLSVKYGPPAFPLPLKWGSYAKALPAFGCFDGVQSKKALRGQT